MGESGRVAGRTEGIRELYVSRTTSLRGYLFGRVGGLVVGGTATRTTGGAAAELRDIQQQPDPLHGPGHVLGRGERPVVHLTEHAAHITPSCATVASPSSVPAPINRSRSSLLRMNWWK